MKWNRTYFTYALIINLFTVWASAAPVIYPVLDNVVGEWNSGGQEKVIQNSEMSALDRKVWEEFLARDKEPSQWRISRNGRQISARKGTGALEIFEIVGENPVRLKLNSGQEFVVDTTVSLKENLSKIEVMKSANGWAWPFWSEAHAIPLLAVGGIVALGIVVGLVYAAVKTTNSSEKSKFLKHCDDSELTEKNVEAFAELVGELNRSLAACKADCSEIRGKLQCITKIGKRSESVLKARRFSIEYKSDGIFLSRAGLLDGFKQIQKMADPIGSGKRQ